MSDKMLGQRFPKMVLKSTVGNEAEIPEIFLGQWTLLYFYPKDDTPGCTVQACSYRDRNQEIQEAGIQLLGVSMDALDSHGAFIDKFQLNFPLLADTDGTLSEYLGVYGDQEWKGQVSKGLSRDTFLVGPEGVIVKVWRKVNPKTTVEETVTSAQTEIAKR